MLFVPSCTTGDDENLIKCRTVSRSWSEFTENEVIFYKRIIKKLIGGYEDFIDTWKLVMKKADIEMIKEISVAVKFFLSKHPGNCLDFAKLKIADIELCHTLHFTLAQKLLMWLFVNLS